MLLCRYENFRCPSSLGARPSSGVRIENYFFNYWTDSAEIWHTCLDPKVSSASGAKLEQRQASRVTSEMFTDVRTMNIVNEYGLDTNISSIFCAKTVLYPPIGAKIENRVSEPKNSRKLC